MKTIRQMKLILSTQHKTRTANLPVQDFLLAIVNKPLFWFLAILGLVTNSYAIELTLRGYVYTAVTGYGPPYRHAAEYSSIDTLCNDYWMNGASTGVLLDIPPGNIVECKRIADGATNRNAWATPICPAGYDAALFSNNPFYQCYKVVCIAPGSTYNPNNGYCERPSCTTNGVRDNLGQCASPNWGKEPTQPACPLKTANPINAGVGSKFEEEVLFRSSGASPLEYLLTYSSRVVNSDFRPVWEHGLFRVSNFDRKLVLNYSSRWLDAAPTSVSGSRPNGQALLFTPEANGFYVPASDINDRLKRVVDTNGKTTAWQLYNAQLDELETYSMHGTLLSIAGRDGRTMNLVYDPSARLSKISDHTGRTLKLNFDTLGRILQIVQPDNNSLNFTYDSSNNLSTVTYPDAKVRTYHYEDARFSNNLTGITDENGVRYAAWTYDIQGRAISSEHAGGVDRHELTYNTGNTIVKDPLGTVRTKNLTTILDVVKSTGGNQPGGSGCSASTSNLTYDANGNIATRTDFNGNTTTYTYDLTRNLETKRVEADSKPEARTISTTWHSYWRLPTQVAEPKKLTTNVYNGDVGVYCAPISATVLSINGGTQPIGVLCSKTEQATTDLTGNAAFTATVTGSPRTWTYTYNQYGQVLTADGPRTDVADVTTTTYYAADDPDLGKRGNIATVSNALGHLTRYTAYDLNGRPLSITDPNSVVTTLSYWPRGWLKSMSVAGATTTYDYTAWGGLEKVTYADSTWAQYHYDDAHRLTGISDRKGNHVAYTLDAMDNTTRTEWQNPDGTPAKRQDATFDALGRLYQEISTRNATDYTTIHGYDANGNPTTTTNPKGKTTTTQYDALDRPIKVTDALNGLTGLDYDRQGQLTQLKAPNNAQTSFTVDGLGNVTQEISADRGTQTGTYDAAGNRLTLSDARGLQETRTYDALNRPLTANYPTTGENVTWTWDSASGCSNGIGRLCKITDNGGNTSFSYDTHGNPVSETRKEGSVTLPAAQYQWSGADRLQTLITPSGKVLTLERGIDGRIQQLSTAIGSNSQLALVSNIQTDALGNTLTQAFGNNATQTRSFNTDGSLSNQIDAPAILPWFSNTGPSFDYAGLLVATPQIGWQDWVWHTVTDDIDHDGDLDLVLYFNGANEQFRDIACSYDCGDWYTGPEFGVLVYLENVGGTYVRRPFTSGQDLIPGDIAQILTLDYNNDGKMDLLLVLDQVSTSSSLSRNYASTPYRRLVLFKNDSGPSFANAGNPNGSHFSDVTTAVGLSQATWYAEGRVLDLNGDGYPDILGVAADANYTVLGDAFVYVPATGTYQLRSTAGLPRPLWNASLVDLDSDGKPDLVAQDGTAGLRFFRNLGNLGFAEWTNSADLTSLVGRWFVKFIPADMDDDGKMDLLIVETDQVGTHPNQLYNGARMRLLRNAGTTGNSITMAEQAVPAFAPDGNYDEIAYGGTVGDVNNDGRLDVVLAARDGGSRLLVADGFGSYQHPENSGIVVGLAGPNSRFADPTLVDFNGDGRVDLLAAETTNTINSGNYLLRNSGTATATRNGITVELTGKSQAAAPSSGKDAFGARVEVTAGGRTQTRQILPVMGLSRRLHFGLGDSKTGIQIKIYWPDGATPQVLSGDSSVNAILRVSQP